MNRYKTIENEYYEIYVPEEFEEYGKEVLEYSTDKLKEYLKFFKENSFGEKIRGSLLTTREDFVKRIKELDPNGNPPSWAQGCFYGGETQILVDPQNIYLRFCTLAHESFHLLFQKFVYEKNNMDRIVWLDESLAGNFDGTTIKLIQNGEFIEIIKSLKSNLKLPKMEELEFSKSNIKTDDYDGYDLFKVVGRYLIETKTEEELFDYINNEETILKDGSTILDDSIKYFSNKFNLN